MSDYRTAVSRLGTALASRKSDTSYTGRGAYELQAQELKYKVQLLEILRKLKEDADDREAKLKLASIRAEIKLFEIQQRSAIESDKITAANFRTKFKEISANKRKLVEKQASYALKYASSYDAIDRAMEDYVRTTKATGSNVVDEIWQAFGEGQSVEAKTVKGYNQQDPRFLGSFERAVELSNLKSHKPLFTKGKDNTYVLNEAVAIDLGIQPDSDDYKLIQSKTEAYNKGKVAAAAYISESDAEVKTAERLLAEAKAAYDDGDEESGREKLEQFKSLQSKTESSFNIRYDVGDREENQRILDRETENGRLYKQVEALLGASGKKSPTRRENDARTIADSEFQQWARDHGYDAIGKVYVDEDGNKSYITGGDDKVALYHFSKEMKRAPGDYGANPGGTGEIVDVTIIDENGDPQVIRGERLRIHPADPYGTVRVDTKDGVVALTRDQMKSLTVIHRPSVGQTLGDKIASGNWFAKTFDDFSDYSYQGDTDDLARTADGLFVISEAGTPMTQEQYDDARSDLAAEAGLKIVNMGEGADTSKGQEYLYLGNDKNGVGIYQEIDEANVLTPVKSLNVRKTLDTKAKRDAYLASSEIDPETGETKNVVVGLLTKDSIFEEEIDGVKRPVIGDYAKALIGSDLDDAGNPISKETLAAAKEVRASQTRETAEKLTAEDLKSKGVTTTARVPASYLKEGFQVREIGDVASTPWSELIKPEVEPETEEESEEGLSRKERQARRLERRPFGPRGERQDARRERREDTAKEDSEPDEAYLEARQTEERGKKVWDKSIRRARLLAMLKGKTVDPDPIAGSMDMSSAADEIKLALSGYGAPSEIPESPDPTESMTDVADDVRATAGVGLLGIQANRLERIPLQKGERQDARTARIKERRQRRANRLERRPLEKKDKDSVESDAQVSNQIVPTSGMV